MKKVEKNICELDKCPIRTVLDRFGDKWSILVIMILSGNGKLRFNEINKMMTDISQKMLTVTLRTLEADGLVSRKIFPEIPPRVEYELTDMGKSLVPHIKGLSDWADEHLTAINKSRKKFAA
jgi:DNA-binding HxlR family transcriptional regulator